MEEWAVKVVKHFVSNQLKITLYIIKMKVTFLFDFIFEK